MNNKKKGLYNFAYSLFGQAVTISIGFLLPRLFIVNYGSDVNGLLNSLNQLFVYLSLFEAGVGAVTLQALYKPIATGDENKINGILAATHRYYRKTGLLYLLALILISLIYPIVVKSNLSYTTVCFTILFHGLSNVILFFFQGKYKIFLQAEGKNYIITNVTTVITLLTSVGKIIGLSLKLNIVLIMGGAFFINMIQVIYIIWYIRRKHIWINLKVTPDYEAINQKNAMLIHQLAGMIFQNTDILILTFVCDLKVVSVYSMYKLVTLHVGSIIQQGINSVSFAFGQMFSTRLETYKKKIDIFETYFSAIVFGIYTVVLYLYIPFMRLYTQNVTDIEYIDYGLPGLFIAIELLATMRLTSLNTINYAGHFKKTLPQSIAETIINLIVSLVLVFHIGIYGVLIGTIVALLYRTNDVIIYANKKILKRKALKTYGIYGVNFISFILVYIIFKYCIQTDISSFIQLLFKGVYCGIIAVTVFVCLQSVIFWKQTKELLQNLNNYRKKKFEG